MCQDVDVAVFEKGHPGEGIPVVPYLPGSGVEDVGGSGLPHGGWGVCATGLEGTGGGGEGGIFEIGGLAADPRAMHADKGFSGYKLGERFAPGERLRGERLVEMRLKRHQALGMVRGQVRFAC